MMTIEEIELACERNLPLDFTRHDLEVPELLLRETFYPLGFPVELRTNSAEILAQAHELWSVFGQSFETEPIRVDVHVVDVDHGNEEASEGAESCPPAPVFRMMQPLLISIADVNNYSIADLERRRTQIVITRTTERHKNYLGYFFLGGAALCHVATRYTTPVHGACVALEGRGVLLCGDSGAGKSTLAYACARAGWTYITDDATFILNEHLAAGGGRLATGNCHQVRFRPSATEFFPEIAGLEITPRAAGKPSIELPTAPMKSLTCAQTVQIDYLVFLNRRVPHPPHLRPYSKEVARQYLRQVLYGSASSLSEQYVSLERLLTAEVFELRYSDLDWAIDRLQTLVREGC